MQGAIASGALNVISPVFDTWQTVDLQSEEEIEGHRF